MASTSGPAERRAKRRVRAPVKFDAATDAGYDRAELQRALRASVKHVKRTASTAVPECPVFRPKAEEFRDPFAYIKSISAEGIKAGIVKVVPPEGWKPVFNAEAGAPGGIGLPFETKLQAVNRLQEGLCFAEGRSYTRDTYKAMADEFAAKWLAAAERLTAERGMTRSRAQARALEEEFWRVVETNTEEVKVEYGSDLDADVYGSGFARLTPQPRGEPGSQSSGDTLTPGDVDVDGTPHAWDFGELVEHPSNLLRVIGANIPGLTRPWLYLGMMFAAFCWHVEDHYLCSVNYLHAGAPKTWYGIPGTSADAFERAVREIVPSLVESAPDLLHRIVTLVPPALLRDAHGVEVFQTLQEPGEFVVTWPRAYHAGFSHGYNVGEAVNFGTAEWVPMGRIAVEHYSAGVGKRDAVFSHDRLMLETARSFASKMMGVRAPWIARMAETLREELGTIVREQEEGRTALLRRGVPAHPPRRVTLTAAGGYPYGEDTDEDEDECCALCKSMPYLAVVHCASCWREAEARELAEAVKRARAEGKSTAGAAWAAAARARREASGTHPRGERSGLTRGSGRRRVDFPVFCLKHALDGCRHAANDRVVEVRAETERVREVLETLAAM